jgi:hypothetical protein
MIDLQILPRKAQNELIDFYHFLVERYANGNKQKLSKTNNIATQVTRFFDQFEIDLSNYKFNRDEIYDR